MKKRFNQNEYLRPFSISHFTMLKYKFLKIWIIATSHHFWMNNWSKSNMAGHCWEKPLNTSLRQALSQKTTISKSISDGFTINCGSVKQSGKKYSITGDPRLMQISLLQISFLSKIQNRISEKTRRKIILLSCKKFVETQFLGVVEFPSILSIQFFKVAGFPSNFGIQFFKVVEFPSDFWIFVRNVTTSKNKWE